MKNEKISFFDVIRFYKTVREHLKKQYPNAKICR